MNNAWRKGAVALTLLLAALLIGLPLIAVGAFEGIWFRSHDGMNYPYWLAQFSQAIAHGILYPRWMPQQMGGYGYPTFVFYQPGFFYFATPLSLLLQDNVAAVAVAAIGACFTGGAGAYRLSRRWNGPGLSVICALLFMLMPYAAHNLYTRGDFTEYFAMQLLPWNLYFALRLADKVQAGKPVGLGVAACAALTAMVIVSHPFVSLFFLPLLTAMLLMEALRGAHRIETLWVGGITLLMALALTAPYWLTLLQLKPAVDYSRTAYNPLHTLYNPFTGKDASARVLFLHNWLVIPAALGFALAWRERRLRIVAVLGAFYLLMMLEASHPLWQLLFPVLHFVQFPWRVLSVLATIQLIGIAQLFSWLAQRLLVQQVLAIAALLVVFAAAHLASRPPLAGVNYHQEITRLEQQKDRLPRVVATDFDPRTMQPQGLFNRHAFQVPALTMGLGAWDAGAVSVSPESTPFVTQGELTLLRPGAVLLNQFYFPGWRAEANGKPVQPDAGANGRVRLQFSQPGQYTLRLWYDGPPGWRVRNLLILFSMTILSAGVYWRRKWFRNA